MARRREVDENEIPEDLKFQRYAHDYETFPRRTVKPNLGHEKDLTIRSKLYNRMPDREKRRRILE